MTRRSAILAIFGAPLAKFDIFKVLRGNTTQSRGPVLTIDLSKWTGLSFVLNGEEVFVPAKEIFTALKEGA
jgi:hypothetical protein